MAKKKGFDFKQLGRFFFQKGERIGLAVSAVIMLLLVLLGVMAAASTQDWASIMKKETDAKNIWLQSQMPDPKLGVLEEKDRVRTDWTPLSAKLIAASSGVNWFNLEETNDNKRRNPNALAVNETEMQLDFIRGAYYAYEVDFNKGQFGAYVPPQTKPTNLTPARTIRPKRGMVVVSTTFPYHEQLLNFQKHLRFGTLDDLKSRPEDLPKFLGLIVSRYEVFPDGKTGAEVPIFKYDEQRDRTTPFPGVDIALKESIFQTVPAELRPFIRPGLVTPLPEMAVGTYPALNLDTIKAVEIKPLGVTPAGGNPNMMQPQPPRGGFPNFPNFGQPQPGGGDQALFQSLPWNALPKQMQEKFAGKFNYFEPSGMADPQGAAPGPGPGPMFFPPRPEGGRGNEGGNIGGQEGNPEQLDKLLVRFFDVDLEPGKTYRYTIQVRLANPNLNRKDVAAAHMANVKEFVSPIVPTPPITVPGDFGYYAIDQTPDSKASGNDDPRDRPVTADRAPLQLQRWTEKENGNLVGDWVVAERVLVRRGEIIPRSVIAEVAEWNASKETFEIGSTTQKGGKSTPGVPVEFRLGNPPPVLVDFVGGKRNDYRDDRFSGIYQMKDEAELELLVLSPEGKLIVRNSAIDNNVNTPSGKDRHERYTQWRDRLRQLRGGAIDDKKGPASIFPGS